MNLILPQRKSSGFTLLELLTVVAIIGLISTIVLGALNTARLKAKDSKVKQEVVQLRNLIELEYSDTNPASYANLQPGTWYYSAADCAAANFGASAYATKAKELCNAIVSNSSANFFGNNILYLGNATSNTTRFSIMAYLPYKSTFYCVGSTGSSDVTVSAPPWSQAGCYNNP